MIAETAETYLSSVSGSDAVRKAMATESGFDADLWAQISSEMGWQLTHIPEAYSGLGLGFVELCILHEQMGQRLLCSPFFSTVSLAANALLVAGNVEQKQTVLGAIAEQGSRYALAYADGSRSVGCDAVSATYSMQADTAVLNGHYHYVIDGHSAEELIVVARLEGTSGDDGIGLFLVSADEQGVSAKWTPSMDQTRKLAEIKLHDVEVSSDKTMPNAGSSGAAFEDILALASICLAAEQLGVAEQSLQLTLDYIQQRNQFGRAVGGFQSMKHKAADMMTKLEASRSAVYYAACIADEYLQAGELAGELLEAASIAKAYASEAAFFNAGCAIQMHGGVGFTWEYDVHLYFKRAKAAQVSFGDSAWHKERLAKIILGELA